VGSLLIDLFAMVLGIILQVAQRVRLTEDAVFSVCERQELCGSGLAARNKKVRNSRGRKFEFELSRGNFIVRGARSVSYFL